MDVTILRDQLNPEWDTFLKGRPEGCYQQSSLWAQLKATTSGWRGMQVIVKDQGQIIGGAQVLLYHLPLYGSIGYIANGPVIASQDPPIQDLIIDQIEQAIRQTKILFLKVQPPYPREELGSYFMKRGARLSNFAATIRATVLIDLRPEPEAILAQVSAKRRNTIRRAERRGVVVRPGTEADMPAFIRLRKEHGASRDYNTGPADYYYAQRDLFSAGDFYSLFLAEYQGELLAASVNIIFGQVATGLILVTSDQHRELNAPALLNWKNILWARERGCTWYDFGGIRVDEAEALLNDKPLPDTHSGHRAGYKRSFGGQIIIRPEAYDLSYLPPRQLTTQLMTSLTEVKRITKFITTYLPR